jgi:hypothetical protein
MINADKEFLNWLADRLVHKYGESENVDFVLHLRSLADTEPHQSPADFNLADLQAEYWALAGLEDQATSASDTDSVTKFSSRKLEIWNQIVKELYRRINDVSNNSKVS